MVGNVYNNIHFQGVVLVGIRRHISTIFEGVVLGFAVVIVKLPICISAVGRSIRSFNDGL